MSDIDTVIDMLRRVATMDGAARSRGSMTPRSGSTAAEAARVDAKRLCGRTDVELRAIRAQATEFATEGLQWPDWIDVGPAVTVVVEYTMRAWLADVCGDLLRPAQREALRAPYERFATREPYFAEAAEERVETPAETTGAGWSTLGSYEGSGDYYDGDSGGGDCGCPNCRDRRWFRLRGLYDRDA
jgi:hypothetical protein